jgi:hypothetical protein
MNTDKQLLRNPCLSVLICGLFACCQALHAQTFPSDPRAKKAIDDAVAALGGQRFLTMEDRVESGRAYSFYRDKISGLSIATIYTQYISVPPEKTGQDLGVRERDVFGKTEEYGYTLFREKGAWEVTYKGPRDLDDERIERYHRTTLNDVLYILRMRLDEPGMSFDWKGSDVVENQPVDMVDIVDSENRVVTVCFNQFTKLPVRQTMVWHDPKTKDRNEEVTRYARYREEGGVQWPQQITRDRNGEKIYQIFSDFVLINPGLSDAVFAIPTGPATKTPFKLPRQKP